jgi:hypothetical protein
MSTDKRQYQRDVARQVVGANLGVLGQDVMTQIANLIQPVHETRAIRDWELFFENVVPWSFTAFQAAVAGERSGVALALDAGAPSSSFLLFQEMNAWPNAGGGSGFKLTTQAEVVATYGVNGTRVVCRDNRVMSPNPAYRADFIIPYSGSDVTFIGDNLLEIGLASTRTSFTKFTIVKPGFAAIVEGDTNNIGVGVSFHGLAFGLLG